MAEAGTGRKPLGPAEVAFEPPACPFGLPAGVDAQELLADSRQRHPGAVGVQQIHVEVEVRLIIGRERVFRRRLVGQFYRRVSHTRSLKPFRAEALDLSANYIC